MKVYKKSNESKTFHTENTIKMSKKEFAISLCVSLVLLFYISLIVQHIYLVVFVASKMSISVEKFRDLKINSLFIRDG